MALNTCLHCDLKHRATCSQTLAPAPARFPGLYGTLAVAAGYLLHLDPLGGLHWNTHDALLGLKCAVPILLLDAALMLPNYSPGTTTKVGAAWRRKRSLEASAAVLLACRPSGTRGGARGWVRQQCCCFGDMCCLAVAVNSCAADHQAQGASCGG